MVRLKLGSTEEGGNGRELPDSQSLVLFVDPIVVLSTIVPIVDTICVFLTSAVIVNGVAGGGGGTITR